MKDGMEHPTRERLWISNESPAIHSRFHGHREKEGSFVMELSLEIQRAKEKNVRVVCCVFFVFKRVYVVKEFEFVCKIRVYRDQQVYISWLRRS